MRNTGPRKVSDLGPFFKNKPLILMRFSALTLIFVLPLVVPFIAIFDRLKNGTSVGLHFTALKKFLPELWWYGTAKYVEGLEAPSKEGKS